MHWQILIIPLIALVVWIIGTLYKSEDDQNKKRVGRRPPFSPQRGGGRGEGRPPNRRVVTDLDRFLEEARRRRQPAELRKAPPTRPLEARPTSREAQRRPQETPRSSRRVVATEEVLVALPAPQPQPRPLEPPPLAEPVAALPAPSEPPPPSPRAARPSPIRQQVRSLLSRPQTAATAVVLREIFDRPLCKRRR